MLKTLVWKEGRELVPLAALALAVQGLLYFVNSGFSLVPNVDARGIIPFVADSTLTMWLFVGGIGAVALGLWQTLWESGRGTFQFLLHRPLERSSAFTIKLAIGIAATYAISGLPILAYALWAATPETHASPFFWSMTSTAWLIWFRLPLVYLGAFLSGIRPGRWFGTRAFPLAAGVLSVALVEGLEVLWPLASVVGTLALGAGFLLAIQRVAATRDYS